MSLLASVAQVVLAGQVVAAVQVSAQTYLLSVSSTMQA
jgi:hypothetical protein